jgi:hypothetical protein
VRSVITNLLPGDIATAISTERLGTIAHKSTFVHLGDPAAIVSTGARGSRRPGRTVRKGNQGITFVLSRQVFFSDVIFSIRPRKVD